MRRGRDAWILVVLLLAFVGATVFLTRESEEQKTQTRPSTYNAGRHGTRAFYELLRRLGMQTRRFEHPLTELPAEAGLLVIVEPTQRPYQAAEVAAVQKWMEAGGTVLHVAFTDAQGQFQRSLAYQEANPTLAKSAATTAAPATGTPFTEDVSALRISGDTAIDIEMPEKVKKLVTAGGEVYAVTWPEKKGRVVLVSRAVAVRNEELKQDPLDNPVFYANIARESAKQSRPVILFDEYHQGYGARELVDRSLWGALAPGVRAAVWYLFFGFVVLVFALNRRFGPVKELPSADYRPSTEYIASMAALYQRSGAGVLALEAIHRDLMREMAARLDTDPADPPEQIAGAAHKRLGWDAAQTEAALRRCLEVIGAPNASGKETEQEITRLSQQLHTMRMDLRTHKV